ncbi:MAG: hypothetical protein OXN84_07120, partial [Albidovulum sp.]|nr:hypothetical protein [Albidovulum sp.]
FFHVGIGGGRRGPRSTPVSTGPAASGGGPTTGGAWHSPTFRRYRPDPVEPIRVEEAGWTFH